MTNYELYGQSTFDGGLTWQWMKLTTHKSREAATKAAARRGKSYRSMKIHAVTIERLPKWLGGNDGAHLRS